MRTQALTAIIILLLHFQQTQAVQEGTDTGVINISTLNYQYSHQEIKDYWAVTKIYPQLQAQRMKEKQDQAKNMQKSPKGQQKGNKKQIKWRLNNAFELSNFIVDENGIEVQLRSSEAIAQSQIKQPKQMEKKNNKNDIPASRQKESKKQMKTLQTIESPSATEQVSVNVNKSTKMNVGAIIFTLACLLATTFYCIRRCFKEKVVRKFQYKPLSYSSEIEIKDCESQIMFDRGQRGSLRYSDEEY